RARGSDRNLRFEHCRQDAGLWPRREDHLFAGIIPRIRLDGSHLAASERETRRRDILQDTPAEIAERPRIGLDGPLRIGVAAAGEISAPYIVARQRRHLAHLGGVDPFGWKSLGVGVVDPALHGFELLASQRDAQTARLEFSRVTE